MLLLVIIRTNGCHLSPSLLHHSSPLFSYRQKNWKRPLPISALLGFNMYTTNLSHPPIQTRVSAYAIPGRERSAKGDTPLYPIRHVRNNSEPSSYTNPRFGLCHPRGERSATENYHPTQELRRCAGERTWREEQSRLYQTRKEERKKEFVFEGIIRVEERICSEVKKKTSDKETG